MRPSSTQTTVHGVLGAAAVAASGAAAVITRGALTAAPETFTEANPVSVGAFGVLGMDMTLYAFVLALALGVVGVQRLATRVGGRSGYVAGSVSLGLIALGHLADAVSDAALTGSVMETVVGGAVDPAFLAGMSATLGVAFTLTVPRWRERALNAARAQTTVVMTERRQRHAHAAVVVAVALALLLPAVAPAVTSAAASGVGSGHPTSVESPVGAGVGGAGSALGAASVSTNTNDEDDQVYATDGDNIIAYDTDGNQQWSTGVVTSPDGIWIEALPDGRVAYAADTGSNGEVGVLYPNGTVQSSNTFSWSPQKTIHVDHENGYIYSDDGTSIYQIYLDNSTLKNSGQSYTSFYGISSGNVAGEDLIYISVYDGSTKYKALYPSNLTEAWSAPAGEAYSGFDIVVNESTGYGYYARDGASNANAGFVKFNLETQSTVSKNAFKNAAGAKTLSLKQGPDGVIYGADGNLNTYASYPNGTGIWKSGTGGTIAVNEHGEVFSGGYVRTSYNQDNTQRLDPSDGTSMWSVSDSSFGVTTASVRPSGESPQETVSGTVVSCPVTTPDCSPSEQTVVPNAVVEVWAVDTDVAGDGTPTEELDQVQDVIPSGWDAEINLAGSDGLFRSVPTGGHYVAVHSREDIGTAPWVDSADLNPPMVTAESGEPLALTMWDPDANSRGLAGLSNEYDSQLPGRSARSGTIVVEQVAPDGSTISKKKVEIDKTAGGGFADPSSLSYAEVRLSPGFYRVHPEGEHENGYIIRVGGMDMIADTIEDTLTNIDNQLTTQAKEASDELDSGRLVRKRVRADGDGDFNVSLPSTVTKVAVQSYKHPDLKGTDAANVSLADVRSRVEEDANESVYISTSVERHDVPASNIRVRTLEVSYAPYMNQTAFQDRWEDLLKRLLNQTLDGFAAEYLNATRENLTEMRDRLDELRRQNERLDSRYRELLSEFEERNNRDPDTEEEIRLLRESVRDLQGELDAEEPDYGYTNGTVSADIVYSGDLDDDAVAVTAHFPNLGVSKPVPSEYVTVEKRIGESDVVKIQEYPVGNSTRMVTFSVTVSGEDGEKLGNDKFTWRNPQLSGAMLDIQSVKASTLIPGPGENVTLTLSESDESVSISSVSARVVGPDGNEVATHDTPHGTEFTTDGAGRYVVTFNVTASDGTNYVERMVMKADDQQVDNPPSIRVRDGFTGRFVVASDGLETGAVSQSGGVVTVTAVAPSDNIPSRVDVYTEQVSGSVSEVKVNVMQASGDTTSPSSIRKHVSVFVHTTHVTENAVVYRNGDEPLPARGESAAGRVVCDGETEGCTIASYTDAGGQATFTVDNNPGAVTAALHWVRLNTPVAVPILFMGGWDFLAALIPFAILRKRRSAV